VRITELDYLGGSPLDLLGSASYALGDRGGVGSEWDCVGCPEGLRVFWTLEVVGGHGLLVEERDGQQSESE
jgi:hypothetical protein